MAKFCSKCGNELKEGARFCSVCGNPVKQVQSAQSEATAGTNEERQGVSSQQQREIGFWLIVKKARRF